ncbi:MAG: TraB/GumN family protein, partial [Prevotellaceae bacterium]|nr:TraB/GumN family protein [Prevotellaceae bacterium]
MKKLIALLISGFSFAAPCFSQSSVWEISKNGKTLYLGGSVHILRSEDFPLPKEFDAAFEKAQLIVFEADVEQLATQEITQTIIAASMLPGDRTLQSILDTNTYEQLKALCEKFSLPMEKLQKIKPVMLLNTLLVQQLQQFGLTSQGVDAYYLAQAKEAGKETGFLETADQQIAMLTGIGEGYENEYVQYSLEDFDKMEKEIPILISSWKKGVFDELLPDILRVKEKFPTAYNALFTERNNDWLPKIENYLSGDKVTLVIVGLAHLHGSDGLLDILKN